MKRDIQATLAKYAAVGPVLESAVAAGGRRQSRSPSATAATRWFRRLPVWLGRRFARGAGRLPATGADGPHSTPWRRTAPHPAGSTRHGAEASSRPEGWRVSSTTVGRLAWARLQSPLRTATRSSSDPDSIWPPASRWSRRRRRRSGGNFDGGREWSRSRRRRCWCMISRPIAVSGQGDSVGGEHSAATKPGVSVLGREHWWREVHFVDKSEPSETR